MIVGFTGTRKGLTDRQAKRLFVALSVFKKRFNLTEVRHGDCIGADAHFAGIASGLGLLVVSHPPIKHDLRAFKGDKFLSPKPYLERNRDIVDNSDFMIACPSERKEELRSGTWYTIRYTKKVSKPLGIIYPGDK